MTHEASPLLRDEGPAYQSNNSNAPSLSSVVSTSGEIDTTKANDALLKKRLNGASIYAVFSGIWIAVILSSLDSSIVATIYPQIDGRISDVFGRKSSMLFASSVFFIGSLLCGAATNLWALVIARAIAGIGGGGINCLTTVITADLVPLRERGKFQGYGNIAYAVGSVLGAPLGGFITDSLGWRFCFFINLPLLVVTIYVATKLLTNYNLEENTSGETLSERLKKIDYAGAITIVSAVICFLMATSLGGNIMPWSAPIVLGCFASAVVLAIAFCIIEAKYAIHPLMPWDIISSRTPLACSSANLWCVMATTSLIYVTPLFYQALLGYSPSTAGVYIMPKVASVSFGSVMSGIYMSKTGEYRKITIVGSLMAFISMAGYSMWTPSTPYYFQFFCLLIDGLSLGVIITTTLIAMHSCVDPSEIATITSMSYLFRSIGGVVGISLTSAIFQGVVKQILQEKITGPDAALYIEIARKSMTEVRELLPEDVLTIVLDAYQVGLRYTFTACAGLAGLSFFSTFFIESFDLSRRVPIQKKK
ncbi:hypothetical protein INT47_004187 [Mucor saturninus]|uniref:Major facilitator superfamily (MFS) profile domain-containing protein n=1 Tax=Mucor saturninus TaxID=64648 RepID=A0A8H7UWY7_9FUNG|nr:hypothetical protein INT47_004187 [Mucor saturninus]